MVVFHVSTFILHLQCIEPGGFYLRIDFGNPSVPNCQRALPAALRTRQGLDPPRDFALGGNCYAR